MARKDNVDFGDLGLTRSQDQEVRAILDSWQQQRQRLESAQLQQAASTNRYRRTFSDGDMGGEVTMSVTPTMYHQFGNYYGYQCWSDDDFCRAVMKHYPETRVISQSATTTILAPQWPIANGQSPTTRKLKFSKTYAEPKTKTITTP